MTLRNPWLCALHAGLSLLFFAVLLVVAVGGASGWVDSLLISLLSGVLVWLNIKYSFDVFIRLEGGSVEVVNYFKKYTIPIVLIEEIECDNRISIKMRDGTVYDSMAFPDSLFSLVTGGSASRSAGKRIEAFLIGRQRGESVNLGEVFVRSEYRASLGLGVASVVFSTLFYSIFFWLFGGV